MDGNPTILVTEDDANDMTFLALAFKKAGSSATVHFVQNARGAIDYCKERDRMRTAPISHSRTCSWWI
jgi:hypothetical protein